MEKQSFNAIAAFIERENPATPCLVLDVEGVRNKYRALKRSLPDSTCHYAIKANPAEEILKVLAEEGSSFDIASPNELKLCLKVGIEPHRILYSNTIKKASEIKEAYNLGIRVFAFDSLAELEKIAENAPEAKVLCRILTEGVGAQWPLSRKFGCNDASAIELMQKASEMGLVPYGISFHVGSQMIVTEPWDVAIGRCAKIFSALSAKGIELEVINLGGGFPARYREDIPSIEEIGAYIRNSLNKHFDNNPPKTLAEPGRYMGAESGAILSEVVLVSRNHEDDPRRWVYLDIGKFTGLVEAEAIQYEILTSKDGDGSEREAVVIAGPTCDSIDIIYEHADYKLPMSLKSGDKVMILGTGAYTTTYSSVCFNGFSPLNQHYIDSRDYNQSENQAQSNTSMAVA